VSVDLATFRGLVPGLDGVGDPMVQVWLNLAVKRHNVAVFGSVYDEAMIFYAAHFLQTISGPSGTGGSGAAAGALTGQRDGDLSRSYAAPAASAGGSASDDALRTTEYGRTYLDLRNSRSGVGPFVAGPSCP
jgi:hypothetical protein